MAYKASQWLPCGVFIILAEPYNKEIAAPAAKYYYGGSFYEHEEKAHHKFPVGTVPCIIYDGDSSTASPCSK